MKGSALLPLFVAALTPFLVLTLIVSGTGFGLIAWKPPFLWSHTFGVSGADNGAAVAASDSSGVYVQGYFNSTGVGADSGILFLNKYDPSGGVVWMRTIRSANYSYGNGLSIEPDAIYLSVSNLTGSFVQKYDITGTKLWEREYVNQTSLDDVVSSSTTNLYVAWAKGNALFIREYEGNGGVLWTDEFYNSTYFGVITGLYGSGSGVYIVGDNVVGDPPKNGEFLIEYDQTGHLVLNEQLPLEGVVGVSGDSTGIYLSGASLRKYDFRGSLVWRTQIDSPDPPPLGHSSVSVEASGIYLSLHTNFHDLLMKYDLNGNVVWTLQMGYTQDHDAPGGYRLAPGYGGVYVAASVKEPSDNIAFVGKVSASASLVVFGVNPPLSFFILSGMVVGSAASLFSFRRLRRRRVRPPRIGPAQRSLPSTD